MLESASSAPAGLNAFYSVIAPFYDIEYTGLYGGADIRFYTDLARASGGPVLELGCGTGRALRPIARAGIAVHGIDGSPDMLGRLREALASEPASVRDRVALTEADIRNADIGARFALVISVGNVLHSFLERSEQRGFLRTARRHLQPGGSLVFDVFQPDYRRLLEPPEFTIDMDNTDPETGRRIRRYVRCTQELEFQRFLVEMRWVVEDASGTVMSERTASIWQRWYTFGELQNLLELEGFRVAESWGGFSGEPFGPGAKNQVIRAV